MVEPRADFAQTERHPQSARKRGPRESDGFVALDPASRGVFIISLPLSVAPRVSATCLREAENGLASAEAGGSPKTARVRAALSAG